MSCSAPKSSERASRHAFANKRWAFLALGALLAVLALGLKLGRLKELRRENAALLAATAHLDQLRRDNTELQRLRAVAQQAEQTQKEQAELAKLQAEVEQLRTVAQELPTLRAENQRLQAERAAAAAKAGVAAEEDPFAKARARAMRINCIHNIKQIGLAARIWANDHKEVFPVDFLSLSNELTSPKILTCAGDTARQPAQNWPSFDGSSVSYELLSPGLDSGDPYLVLVRCPLHNNVGMADGSAAQLGSNSRVEKVDGKFKVVRVDPPPNSEP